MRQNQELIKTRPPDPWSANLFLADFITATFVKPLNHCLPDWTGDVGLVCLAVASSVKSMGPRPDLQPRAIHPGKKIPQQDLGLGIHEAVITPDGFFGRDRGLNNWQWPSPRLPAYLMSDTFLASTPDSVSKRTI